MNVLVTGGAGYIGSHACKALAAAGHLPVTLDNLVYGHRWAVQWGPLIEGDIQDSECLVRVMHGYSIDAVMHFAAYAYVGESVSDPGKYFRNNCGGTVNLLDCMVQTGIRNLVFSSTCATYGDPERLPIDENEKQSPVNPYGESKLFVERALRWYEQAHGIRSMCLRYFNAAGADAETQIGESHDPETHLIPLVIEAALGRRPEVRLFGTDYHTPDGTAIRDYIHVSDLAAAHVKAIDALQGGAPSARLNLGTGQGYSVREVVDAVARISGRTVPVREAERRAGDPPVLVAAADLARKTLAWSPEHSSLDNIVRTALAWHEQQAALPR